MAEEPLVSVIIPAHNSEEFLADAVASVLRQTWTRLEALIVNDGSTDGTGDLSDDLAAADRRLRVIHKSHGGVSSARNAGLATASGEYLCFLDADDVFLPHKIESQLEYLRARPWCDLVFSDHYAGDERCTPVRLDCKRPPRIPMNVLLVYRNWFGVMSPLMRLGLQARVGAFDESLTGSEDWDYWIRASRCGVLCYLPGPVAVYRSHPGQAHHSRQRMRTNVERVIRKHFPPGSSEWRAVRAANAWYDAKQWWGERDYARTAACLALAAWHARSARGLKIVVDVLG